MSKLDETASWKWAKRLAQLIGSRFCTHNFWSVLFLSIPILRQQAASPNIWITRCHWFSPYDVRTPAPPPGYWAVARRVESVPAVVCRVPLCATTVPRVTRWRHNTAARHSLLCSNTAIHYLRLDLFEYIGKLFKINSRFNYLYIQWTNVITFIFFSGYMVKQALRTRSCVLRIFSYS